MDVASCADAAKSKPRPSRPMQKEPANESFTNRVSRSGSSATTLASICSYFFLPRLPRFSPSASSRHSSSSASFLRRGIPYLLHRVTYQYGAAGYCIHVRCCIF